MHHCHTEREVVDVVALSHSAPTHLASYETDDAANADIDPQPTARTATVLTILGIPGQMTRGRP